MAWLKSSDNSNQHPAVLAPLAWARGPDDDLDGWDLRLPAVAGLVWLCATYSAGQETDYVVPDGTVALYGGPQWQRLAAWAERAGFWTRIDGGWLLADDSEHLFHIRLRAEIEWERQRKNDNGNPILTVPVRLRDGDACRYCGRIVNWDARTGALAGTYDHRHPGQAARGPDDLVVCCNHCNGRRGKDPQPGRWHTLPAPTSPYYGKTTVEHLANHGHQVPLSTGPRPPVPPGGPRIDPARPDDQPDPAPTPTRRPGTQPDHATPGDPAPSRTTPTHRAAASHPAPSATPATGHRARTTSATPAPPPGHRAIRATPAADPGHRAPRDGTTATPRKQDQHARPDPGRKPAGSSGPKPPTARAPGRVGTGRDGSGAPDPSLPTNRKRGRRARRARPGPPLTPPRPEDHHHG
ncbi:HNH endonuclease [Micromonospora aurantiaca (nom. illeg.)]|uniref:HNH endonuclease n=1 Tax=Micromonospora aurantiaca (nom. illeg.) TaxID=47850 RepID=UPI003437AC0B